MTAWTWLRDPFRREERVPKIVTDWWTGRQRIDMADPATRAHMHKKIREWGEQFGRAALPAAHPPGQDGEGVK